MIPGQDQRKAAMVEVEPLHFLSKNMYNISSVHFLFVVF